MNVRVIGLLTLGVGAVLAVPAVPAGAGGGCHRGAAESAVTAGAVTTVVLERICFTPGATQVERGTAVRFVNRDPVAHVVAGTGWGQYEEMPEGAAFEHTFAEPGVYAYSCYLHPSMNGAVVVTEAGADRPIAVTPVAATAPVGANVKSGFDRGSMGLGAAAGAVAASTLTRVVRRRRSSL